MARYNTEQQTLSVTGATTFTYAFTGGIITLSGTSGYTVTLVSPVVFPGSVQTFYNSTGGNVTLATPVGNIVGNGFSTATSQVIPNSAVFALVADGTNYVITNNEGGAEAFQQAVVLNNTLTANNNVTMSGAGANIAFSPTGSGTVAISPAGTLIMQPGGAGTFSPVGTLTMNPTGAASLTGVSTLTLGTAGQTTTMNGNITAAATNQTVSFTPAGTGSVTISPTGSGGLTIAPTTTGNINNVTIGASTRAAGNFTTLQANSTATLTGAVDINGANVATTISPTGTGTVTIAPASTLTLGTVGVSEIHRGNIAAQQSNQTVVLSPTGTGTVTIAPAGGVTLNPANANVAITPSGTGAITLTSAATGTMNNVTIGGTTRAGANFTTLDANSTVSLSPANANVTVSPTGTGTVTMAPATAGTINNISIGASTRAAGNFTTLDANSTVGLSPANATVTISPSGSGTVTMAPATTGTINNISIGASTRSTGAFTTLQANGTATFSGTIDFFTSANSQNFVTGPAGTITITAGTTGAINNMTIGASTRASARFTTLDVNNTITVNGSTGTAGQVLTSNGSSPAFFAPVKVNRTDAYTSANRTVNGSGQVTGYTLGTYVVSNITYSNTTSAANITSYTEVENGVSQNVAITYLANGMINTITIT